tara:strand:- start:10911 stop:12326 length:1416 start_codon:yes stop_codon:yes gene_type:complete
MTKRKENEKDIHWNNSNFDKTPINSSLSMGCSCGGEKAVEAAEPTPSPDETHEEYMTRCMEVGYSEGECMAAHEGHVFKEEAGYGDACPPGEEMKNGKCVRVSVTNQIKIDSVSAIVEADTGKSIIRITGIAFHSGLNKNNWGLTREGADLAVRQMPDADITLNHPSAEEGHFTRNMSGIDEGVVGFITEAETIDNIDGSWVTRFVGEIHRQELFEALESGLWLRSEYGVSVGGTGIPDEVIEAEDGSFSMWFGSDFDLDHLAIVHKPAYPDARIETVERISIQEETSGDFMYQTENRSNIREGINMTDESAEQIEAVEDAISTVDFENVQADLVFANARIAEYEAAEATKVEEARIGLVEKATEIGLKGHEELSSEVIASLIDSWAEAHPEPSPVEMKPIETIEASTETTIEANETMPIVANWLNQRYLETPEPLYAKAYNLWVKAWNGSLSASEAGIRAPTYEQVKEMI